MHFQLPGPLAARFTILSRLGGGATGKVLLVRDRELERNAVLKVVPLPANRYRDELAERVLLEARILSELRHPRVITLLDFGQVGEVLYLLYPDEAGRDLMSATPSKGLWRADEVRVLLDQVLDALAHLHEHGVVHRDVKPANVLRLGQGEYKLIDMGLAKDTLSRRDLTATDAFVGTPVYASPEQVMGEDPDPRDDLYALGVVAYQLVTGENPFTAEDFRAVLQRQLSYEPPPAHEVTPAVPLPLSRFLERLMAKDREGRPASAQAARETLAGLDRLATSEPRSREAPATNRTRVLPEPEPPPPAPRRRPWLAVVSLLGLGLVVLGTLWPSGAAPPTSGPAPSLSPPAPSPAPGAIPEARARAWRLLARAREDLAARDAALRAGERPGGELGTMIQLEGLLGGGMDLARLVRRAAESASGRAALREWLAPPIADVSQGLAAAREALTGAPDPELALELAAALQPLTPAFHGGFAEDLVEIQPTPDRPPALAYLEAAALGAALDARGLQGRDLGDGRARERALWRRAEAGPPPLAGFAAWRRVRSSARSGATRINLLRDVNRSMDPAGVREAYRELRPDLDGLLPLPRALLLGEVARVHQKAEEELALTRAEATELLRRFAAARGALSAEDDRRLQDAFGAHRLPAAAQSTP